MFTKVAVITEVARYLESIRAPAELYVRLIAALDETPAFWRVACGEDGGWSSKMWVWYLYKQRERETDTDGKSNLESGGSIRTTKFAQVASDD
jgi:hypothetical protein